MKALLVLSVSIALLACTAPARPSGFLPHKPHLTLAEKVTYFERSVRKDLTAVAWLRSPAATRNAERVRELRWFQHALAWHRQLLADARSKLLPDPRTYAGECLAWIIDRENPGWDPQRFNRLGSGAYGLPQALPASKMSSAGSDWRTNPYTQIRWMRGYVASRFGGCENARAWWRTHRSY